MRWGIWVGDGQKALAKVALVCYNLGDVRTFMGGKWATKCLYVVIGLRWNAKWWRTLHAVSSNMCERHVLSTGFLSNSYARVISRLSKLATDNNLSITYYKFPQSLGVFMVFTCSAPCSRFMIKCKHSLYGD